MGRKEHRCNSEPAGARFGCYCSNKGRNENVSPRKIPIVNFRNSHHWSFANFCTMKYYSNHAK